MSADQPPQLDRVGRVVVAGHVVSVQRLSNADDSWAAGTMHPDDGAPPVRFVGVGLPSCLVGARVRLAGFFEVNPVYGEQLLVRDVTVALPAEADAVVRYLVANVVGCGMARATRIVKVLGADCLGRLELDPTLVEPLFPGVIGRHLRLAVEQWAATARRDVKARELTVRLLRAGVRYSDVRKIMQYFENAEAAEVAVLRHPYRLIEVPGLGWKLTDRIAQLLGVGRRDPRRVEAACRFALEAALEHGHCGLPHDEVARRAAALVGFAADDPLVREAVGSLAAAGLAVNAAGLVMLPDIADTEWRLAERVSSMLRVHRTLSPAQHETVRRVLRGADLSASQQNAVLAGLQHGVAIVTGRPGSGKTTTLKTYIQACEALGWSVQLLAPTGKAASRAAAVTGAKASTVHRLLGGAPSTGSGKGVAADVVILDEASMADLAVAEWLLSSIDPSATRVLLVGDGNQLPSVQPGRVLQDLVNSRVVPCVELREVFRQAAGSRIVANAHRLLDQLPLDLTNAPDWKSVLLDGSQPQTDGADKLIEHVQSVMESGVALRDLQVLAPLHRGELGVNTLNDRLQLVLNSAGAIGPRIGGGVRVRLGDRVVMTRNCYDLPDPMYNGEQGVVTGHDARQPAVTIDVAGRTIVLRGVQCLMLRLAWAMTVHRSQGSEYAHTVLAYDHRAHARMLSRAVLYTAITRARTCFHLVGTERAVQETISAGSDPVRYSGLVSQLRALSAPQLDFPESAHAA